MAYDPMLDKLRTADRNTYDTLLKQRAALQAHAYRPTPATARAALEALRVHQGALENEMKVLGELIEASKRSREGLERFILTQPPELPVPPGSLAAQFAAERPIERVPSRY